MAFATEVVRLIRVQMGGDEVAPLYVEVWAAYEVDRANPEEPIVGQFVNVRGGQRPPGFTQSACLYVLNELPAATPIRVELRPTDGSPSRFLGETIPPGRTGLNVQQTVDLIGFTSPAQFTAHVVR